MHPAQTCPHGSTSARAAVVLAVLLVVFVAHWPRGAVGFVFDDKDFIVDNPAVRSLPAAFGHLLSSLPPSQPDRALWRPVTVVSYAADNVLWGGSPRGFAVSSMLIYFALCLAAGVLFDRLLPTPGQAVAATLLFAAHPVHCEAVDAIAGRSELLALLFSTLSTLLLLAALDGRSGRPAALRAAASAAFYGLACGSKETGAAALGLLVVLALAHRPRDGAGRSLPSRIGLLAPHALALTVYLALRFAAIGGLGPTRSPLAGSGATARLATLGAVFAEYLRLLVFPRVLQVDYYYQEKIGLLRAFTPRAAFGILALVALAALTALLLAALARRGEGPGNRGTRVALLAGAGGFLAFLLPVSQIVPLRALMAERFLLAPSLGFTILVVAGAGAFLARWGSAGRGRALATSLIVGGVVMAGVARSYARAGEWRDPVLLWDSTVRALPDDQRVQINLGSALLERGDASGAERVFRAVVARWPKSTAGRFDLGLALEVAGKDTEAGRVFEDLLAIEPGRAKTHRELARVRLTLGDAAGARESAERALSLDPEDDTARAILDAAERRRLP